MQTDKALRIAVVGHTNTGKTSLLRTLTRDRAFGEVDDAPGTTRQVQSATVMLDNQAVLTWYDTPGLEDSVALRDWIDGLHEPGVRLDGPDRIERFLADQTAQRQFEQEHRVLAQVLRSDALLYVVDSRDPVLAKHRDELYLLQSCARPVLPVLNFVASPQAATEPWIQTFTRQGMHIYLSFDTISPPINGLQMMYETLGQLMGERKVVLQALGQQVASARRARINAAVSLLADLCLQAASAQRIVKDDASEVSTATAQQQDEVRQFEQQFTAKLLELYQFSNEDYLPPTQGWSAGHWSTDLFSKETLAELGIDLGKGAAVGAAAGASVDVLTAGLSLGAGTLIGAAAGSAWQGFDRWGKDIKAKLSGQRSLMIADAVLAALATRNVRLIAALEQRGHASMSPVQIDEPGGQELDQRSLLKVVMVARRQSLRMHMLEFVGGLGGKRELTDDFKQVLINAKSLQPFLVDRLH